MTHKIQFCVLKFKVPKSGYIDAQDFESPKKLAAYLTYLDSNRTAYNSYFKWKKHVHFLKEPQLFAPFCDMCLKLHLERVTGQIERKIVSNFSKTWRSKSECKYVPVREGTVEKPRPNLYIYPTSG